MQPTQPLPNVQDTDVAVFILPGGDLITASGLGDVEFATEIMTELNVLSADDRALWTRLFRGGRVLPT